MTDTERGDTERSHVGYARPPARTQFKPGQSGNPRGRPKGVGFKNSLRRAFEENGSSPAEFMRNALADEIRKAVGADEKARDRILKWMEKYFADDEPAS